MHNTLSTDFCHFLSSCWQVEVAKMTTRRFAMFHVGREKSPTWWHKDLQCFLSAGEVANTMTRSLAERCRWQDEMKIRNVSWRWGKFAVTMICNVLRRHVDFAQWHEDLANIRHVGDFAPPTHNKCKTYYRCVIDFSLSKTRYGRNQPL